MFRFGLTAHSPSFFISRPTRRRPTEIPSRNPARIADEARLDGFYVIRTSVEDKALAADRVGGAYRDLARVERAFRSLKTVDLHIRPIHRWLAPRVRAQVFLCMLASCRMAHARAPQTHAVR